MIVLAGDFDLIRFAMKSRFSRDWDWSDKNRESLDFFVGETFPGAELYH